MDAIVRTLEQFLLCLAIVSTAITIYKFCHTSGNKWYELNWTFFFILSLLFGVFFGFLNLPVTNSFLIIGELVAIALHARHPITLEILWQRLALILCAALVVFLVSEVPLSWYRWQTTQVDLSMMKKDQHTPSFQVPVPTHPVKLVITHKPLYMYSGPGNGASYVVWSPDSSKIALAGSTSFQVVDAATGHIFFTYTPSSTGSWLPLGTYAPVWSPDGAKIVLPTNGSLQMRDVATGNILFTDTGTAFYGWSRDSTKIFTGNNSTSELQQLEARTGHVVSKYPLTGYPIQLSPDGTKIAVVVNQTKEDIVDVTTGNTLATNTEVPDNTSKLIWSPDSTKIVSESSHVLHVVDVKTGQTIFIHDFWGFFDLIPDFFIESEIWSPDGTKIVLEANKSMQVWDAKPGKQLFSHDQDLGGVANWSPDSSKVVFNDMSNNTFQLHVVDTSTWQMLVIYDAGSQNYPSAVSWSPEGTKIAVFGTNGTVTIWGYPPQS